MCYVYDVDSLVKTNRSKYYILVLFSTTHMISLYFSPFV
jgi:hypothetical protein